MKFRTKAFGLLLGCVAFGTGAFAQETYGPSNETTQMPGTVSQGPEESARREDSAAMDQQQGDRQQMKMSEAKRTLAPHSVMIETALKSAQQQIRGLRQELQVSEAKPSAKFIDHFRMFSKEINNDLKMAKIHQDELQGEAGRFPEVARSDDLKSSAAAVADINTFNTKWQAKAGTSAYWSNKAQAMNDLDQLDRQLSRAVDKAASFNSSQLEISVG
ncbi:MAG: hypothetical protein NDJ89_17760 [Oligoflexia bacterium]|nr:hypothetical protein [Oligoflexia bacterium]